jgi:hypothetical protein
MSLQKHKSLFAAFSSEKEESSFCGKNAAKKLSAFRDVGRRASAPPHRAAGR